MDYASRMAVASAAYNHDQPYWNTLEFMQYMLFV